MFYLFEKLGGEQVVLILQLAAHLGKALVIIALEQLSLLKLRAEVCVEPLKEGVQIVFGVTLEP